MFGAILLTGPIIAFALNLITPKRSLSLLYGDGRGVTLGLTKKRATVSGSLIIILFPVSICSPDRIPAFISVLCVINNCITVILNN